MGSIVTTMTQAFGDFLSGIGTSIVTFFSGIVLNAEGTALTPFATWALIFVGVGLAITILYALLRKIG